MTWLLEILKICLEYQFLIKRLWDLARVAQISDCTWQFAEELRQSFIKIFEKRKVCSSFRNNI